MFGQTCIHWGFEEVNMKCPLCEEVVENEYLLIAHLLLDHGLPSEMALQLAEDNKDDITDR